MGRTKVRRLIFILVACSLLLYKGLEPAWFIGGVVLILLGQAIQLSSYSILAKNTELTTGGPYRFVRNPFYVGTILKDFGVCVLSGNWIIMAAYPVIFLPILYRRVLKEEKKLREKFGEQYEEYVRRVPRFLPHISSWLKLLGEQRDINPTLLLKNRIFPRILNLWLFIVLVVEVSELRWRRDFFWTVDHLVLLASCAALLYVSFSLNAAGKRIKQAEKSGLKLPEFSEAVEEHEPVRS